MNSALFRALEMILSLDAEIVAIASASVRFALISTLFAAVLGLAAATGLYFRPGRAARVLLVVLNSLMSLPTVVIGLFIYSLLSRSGPLGPWGMLFTPAAIILGQTILALPIIISMVYGALSGLDPSLAETLETFRIPRFKRFLLILNEARLRVLIALVAGFGRVIGEVGVSMMLGGNIRSYTRTITTAIALETSKGEFEQGLALGMILMTISLGITAVMHAGLGREE